MEKSCFVEEMFAGVLCSMSIFLLERENDWVKAEADCLNRLVASRSLSLFRGEVRQGPAARRIRQSVAFGVTVVKRPAEVAKVLTANSDQCCKCVPI